MATATTPKSSEALRVVLPVCTDPNCQRIGKIPGEHFGGKEYCAGVLGSPHRKARMEKRTFELVEGGEAVPPSRPSNNRDTRPTSTRKEAGR